MNMEEKNTDHAQNLTIHQLNEVKLKPFYRHMAFYSLMALIILCIVWEVALDPLPTKIHGLGALKVLPLLFCIQKVYRGDIYAMQWSSMLSLLYVMEGTVRMMSSASIASQWLGLIEFILAGAFYFGCILYVHPAKKIAKIIKKSGL
ncbi:MAG: DUF2069 domain-containing protein [Alcaligenaceae bacterium]|nr:DUF2069 domain-containing protein [Alcaligenaceae bacterium]